MYEVSLFRLVKKWIAAKRHYEDSRLGDELAEVARLEVQIENLVKSIERQRWARHHQTEPTNPIN